MGDKKKSDKKKSECGCSQSDNIGYNPNSVFRIRALEFAMESRTPTRFKDTDDIIKSAKRFEAYILGIEIAE